MLSDEAKAELIVLAHQQRVLDKQSQEWYDKHAKPLFEQCNSVDEYRAVINQFPEMIDTDGTRLEKPGMLHVLLACAQDQVRVRAGEYDAP